MLRKKILPDLVLEKGNLANLKIWSVASSTGQEPYSIAMILYEMSQQLGQSPPQILATDICEKVLTKAMLGKYSEIEINRGLTNEQKLKYFKSDVNNLWTLDSKIRNLVDFKILNLSISFSLKQQFDLILCRNVLIYQRVEAKAKIIQRISDHLRPGGVFLMGSGESLIGLSKDYQQDLTNGISIYKLKKIEKKSA